MSPFRHRRLEPCPLPAGPVAGDLYARITLDERKFAGKANSPEPIARLAFGRVRVPVNAGKTQDLEREEEGSCSQISRSARSSELWFLVSTLADSVNGWRKRPICGYTGRVKNKAKPMFLQRIILYIEFMQNSPLTGIFLE